MILPVNFPKEMVADTNNGVAFRRLSQIIRIFPAIMDFISHSIIIFKCQFAIRPIDCITAGICCLSADFEGGSL